ncbi:ubiquinol-cytochrome-c reductase cytochrome c1, partial [Metarhizium majus ARSEF 297]
MAPPFLSSALGCGSDCRSVEGTYIESSSSQKTVTSEPDQNRTDVGQECRRQKPDQCELTVSRILPSLYPCYLPYRAQHVVLTRAQAILEACCFDFAQKHLPELLEEQGWDSAVAVELNRWTRILNDNLFGRLHLGTSISENNLQSLLVEVRNLRDAAVYRVPTTARSVSQLLRCACQLTEVLGDKKRAMLIGSMKDLVDKQIYILEQHKKSLESTVSSKLHNLAQHHASLSQQKAEIISCMLQLDTERQAQAGAALQRGVEELSLDDHC